MATTFTETTLSTTYKDDFRDSDNYHRILFNSGVGLQARELTQLQTILQKQIERFGNSFYELNFANFRKIISFFIICIIHYSNLSQMIC